MARLTSFVSLPWSVKLLYGLISDNVPINGSKRKNYVILLGALQFVSLATFWVFDISNVNAIAGLLFLANLSGAYLDVIVDALMVTQSRVDEEDGSEQLQTLSWSALGAGGIFGASLGGYLTENSHPRVSFLIYSLFGVVVMILGVFLKVDETENKIGKSVFSTIKTHLVKIKEALYMPEIYQTLLFYILCGLTGPSFSEFMYFYQMEIVKFSKWEYAMLNVMGYATMFLGTLYYNMYLKDKEVRTLLRYACWIGLIGSITSYVFVMRWNLMLGINDTTFIILTDVVTGTLFLAFN